MRKCFSLLAVLFTICATGFVSADTVISATGASQTGGYDNNWRAAYLGAFEIGLGTESHNGAQLGGTFQNSGTDATGNYSYSAGDQFSLNTLQNAYNAANLTGAFVYDNNAWPLAGNDNAWSNLTNQYEDTYWIGSESGRYDSGDGTTNHAAGYYAYETSFYADEAYSFLTGFLATDNALLGIMVNGILLDSWDFIGEAGGESTTFSIAGMFTIDAGDISINDWNTLTFFVNNHNSHADNYGNPAGLWVGDLQLTDSPPAVPEPATMLVFGLGMVGCGAFYGRKRRTKKA